MGILRRFREWREDKNGVLTGPDIDADSLKTDEGTIGGKQLLGGPSSSVKITDSVPFNTYREESSTQPVLLLIRADAVTDGTTEGRIDYDVDESGGTTADYSVRFAYASPNLASGTEVSETTLVYLPAGAQYQIDNDSDPTGLNDISNVLKFTL